MLSVFTFLNIVSFYYIITGRNIEDAVRRSISHMIIVWILLWIGATASVLLTGTTEKAMYAFQQLENILNATNTLVSETSQQLV